MIDFYEGRIPIYTRHAMFLSDGPRSRCLRIGARALQLLTWVTVATAAATVTTSWSEFGDAEHKVERYSSAIVALQKPARGWNSLGAVQKATRDSITNLVITAEAIICEEQASWTSTAAKQDAERACKTKRRRTRSGRPLSA